jgi:hypothetical protein
VALAGACRFRKLFISLHDLINLCCLAAPTVLTLLSRLQVENIKMSDWGKLLFSISSCRFVTDNIWAEGSEDSRARPIQNKALATKNKWEGEDEDEDEPVVSPT